MQSGWESIVLSAGPSLDVVFVSLPHLVHILSNQIFNTPVSICSSSAFAVHNLFFILVSLYAFNVLLKRHSFILNHSMILSSWSGVRMRGLAFFFFLDCDCYCYCDCDCISDCDCDCISDWESNSSGCVEDNSGWTAPTTSPLSEWLLLRLGLSDLSGLPLFLPFGCIIKWELGQQQLETGTGCDDCRSSGVTLTLNVTIHPFLHWPAHPLSIHLITCASPKDSNSQPTDDPVSLVEHFLFTW